MLYREVHVIEVKEALLRLAGKESIRSISVSLVICDNNRKIYYYFYYLPCSEILNYS